MVSFQKLPELSDNKKKRSESDQDSSDQTLPLPPTKKIRRSSEDTIRVQEFLDERRWRSGHNTTPSLLIDVDLRLQTSPLPPVPWRTLHPNPLWKQTQNVCNIRATQNTTLSSSSKDPISLELGLNLQCSTKKSSSSSITNNYCYQDRGANLLKPKHGGDYYTKNFPVAAKLEVDDGEEEEEEEMVAKACMRCHMLVMMCKSCPSCPNCKFMHPLDHHNPKSSTLLLKPRPI